MTRPNAYATIGTAVAVVIVLATWTMVWLEGHGHFAAVDLGPSWFFLPGVLVGLPGFVFAYIVAGERVYLLFPLGIAIDGILYWTIFRGSIALVSFCYRRTCNKKVVA